MLWSSLESLSLAAVSFAMLAMMARYLEADAFGRAAVALGVVQIACSFVDSFFHDAVVQRKGLAATDVDAAHTTGLLMALLLSGAIATWGWLARVHAAPGDPVGVGELALWMSPSVLMAAAAAMPVAQLRRQLAMRPLAIAMAGSRLVAALAAMLALWRGAGVWAIVLNQCLAALLLLLALWAVGAPRARLTLHLSGARRLAGYAAWNSASGLIGANLSRFFQVASGLVLPAAMVGQLALALRVVDMLVSVLVTGVSRVALSRLSAAAREGSDTAAVFMATTRQLAFVMLPVLVLIALLADPLLGFIGRDGWGPAARLVAWFALAQALRSPLFVARDLFAALGRPRLNVLVSVVELATLALLLAVLQDPLVWVARLVVSVPLVMHLLRSRFGIGARQLLATLREPFAAALGMGLLLYAGLELLGPHVAAPLPMLLAGSLAGGLLYAAFAAALLGGARRSAVWQQIFHHRAAGPS
jgi:O-antigen/teichoic acid export membrane protein